MKPVLVVGGGIAGIQASLDLADRGIKVHLIERTPSIGGVMGQLDKTFPTMDLQYMHLGTEDDRVLQASKYPNSHHE